MKGEEGSWRRDGGREAQSSRPLAQVVLPHATQGGTVFRRQPAGYAETQEVLNAVEALAYSDLWLKSIRKLGNS
ncbi:hypothetical protein GN956_G24764 [Arapaima gigas]